MKTLRANICYIKLVYNIFGA